MPALEFSTCFIELDALVDTRMGILVSMTNDERFKNIYLNGYHTRDSDEFPGIDVDLFKQTYKSRTKKVLDNSMVTPMIRLLKEFCFKTVSNIGITPFNYLPKIIINTHPYDLNDEECGALLEAVVLATNKLVDVELVNMSYEAITPIYVKRELSMIILYNYGEWLELHCANKNFTKTICPEVQLIGPGLYPSPMPKNVKKSPDDFARLEKEVDVFINLKIFNVSEFSMIIDLSH
jgi:hypothetical protein